MKVPILAVLGALALLVSHAFPGPPQADDAKQIQGSWNVESITGGPGKPPSQDEIKKMRMKLGKGKFALITGERELSGTYHLDAKKNPKEIDFVETRKVFVDKDGKKQPATSVEVTIGIYELQGDDLKLCLRMRPKGPKAPDQSQFPRPAKLMATEDMALVVLKRDK